MSDRERLIELIGNIQLRGFMERRTENSISVWPVANEKLADYLLAAGVTLLQPKEPRPEPDLTGKCGGCAHSAPTTVYGGSKCYVECKNQEHLQRHCNNRGKYASIHARTAKGCKLYTAKEG